MVSHRDLEFVVITKKYFCVNLMHYFTTLYELQNAVKCEPCYHRELMLGWLVLETISRYGEYFEANLDDLSVFFVFI